LIARLARAGVTPPLSTRSFRALLLWQALAVLAFAAVGGAWAGGPGAVSGALGAAINLVANFVYALMGGVIRPSSPVGALFVILRAEGFKIGLILVQLILVLVLYRELASGPFIVAFIASALMFGIALRVRN
jgi:F0F1-type ATP synthase assembly protein I